MAYFDWHLAPKLGIDRMDAGHREIIEGMEKIKILHDDGPKGDLVQAFDELIAAAKKHFAEEEEYMEDILYEKVWPHKKIHVQLLHHLEEYRDEFVEKDQLDEGIFKFLKDWLYTHISGIDTDYAKTQTGSQ